MAFAAAESAAGVLAGEHPCDQLVAVEQLGPAEQVQRAHAPVHAAHAKVLGRVKDEAVLLLRVDDESYTS